MESLTANRILPNVKDDVFFQCNHCATPLVVDGAAAGMTLTCERCGKPTVVPSFTSGSPEAGVAEAVPVRLAELQRHLKENESQRTEVKGYINQLSIQLHRWQLRLQTLNERNSELTTEIAALEPADPR